MKNMFKFEKVLQPTGEKEPMGGGRKISRRKLLIGLSATSFLGVTGIGNKRNPAEASIGEIDKTPSKPSPAAATEPNEPLLFAQNLAPGELANLFQNQVKSPIEGALYYFNGSSWVLASGGWGGRLTREMGRIDNRSRIINGVSWELYFYRDTTNGSLLCMPFQNK
jgi:hypothetical protein